MASPLQHAVKAIQGYHLIKLDDLHWRPSNLIGPNELRQVFNDTDAEVLWLIVGAPEELEFLKGSKSNMDLSLFYPTDPKQLPNELAGVKWPPESSDE